MKDKNQFILEGNWEGFTTLPEEKLLLVKRKHPFLIIFPMIFLILLCSICITGSFYLFTILFLSTTLFFSSSLSLIIITSSLLIKIYIDWYFNLYIVTNRKILEVRFAPLTAHVLNNVLLDQVNCTEIDIRTDGIINELLDMGNVIITFDRPTHQDEFTFMNIQESRKIGSFLSSNLVNFKKQDFVMPLWYRPKNEKKYKFMEEIFPKPAV